MWRKKNVLIRSDNKETYDWGREFYLLSEHQILCNNILIFIMLNFGEKNRTMDLKSLESK